MKVIVTTTYNDVDEEFLNSMLTRFRLAGWSEAQVNQLKKDGVFKLNSKNPDGMTTAETTISIEKHV